MNEPTDVQTALANVVLSIMRLIDTLQIDTHPCDLAVNFDGRSARLDVAELDSDGHLAAIVASLGADITHGSTFGKPIGLPVQPRGQTH